MTFSFQFTFFTTSSHVFIAVLKFAFISLILSHLSVTMMAVDRLIAIKWPNNYLQIVSKRKPWKYILCVWAAIIVLLHVYLSVLCHSMPILGVDKGSDACNVIYAFVVGLLFIINLLVPFVCHLVIFGIIRNQSMRMRVRTRSFFHQYKATSVVFLYMINIIVTTILYFIIIITEMSPRLRVYYAGIIYLINGIADTCSYVFLFKECRLELLKLVVICCPRVRPYIMRMRIKVYNIGLLRDIHG